MRPGIVLTLTIALLSAPLPLRGGVVEVENEVRLEEAMIESASTPQQHAALADYYAEKATRARESAERHRAMAGLYGGSDIKVVAGMKLHSLAIASLYDEQAREYDHLAATQRGFAK